jgi:hypothetical protein
MQNKNDLFKEALNKAATLNAEEANSMIMIASKTSEQAFSFFKVLAALDPESRSKIIDYWKGLYGKEFATDMVKDYVPMGEKEKEKTASSKTIKKEALSSPGSDANAPVKDIWTPLLGDEYAKDMVKYPGAEYEKMEVEAFSQGLKEHLAKMPTHLAEELLTLMSSGKKK